VGTIMSLSFLLSKKASIKTHLPFAPFLILAAIICQLLGMSIVHHIQN
jgi:prepilin signal peptidase PulO-like enzyme (type II secretory pathway)